jgi:hypothetical protein
MKGHRYTYLSSQREWHQQIVSVLVFLFIFIGGGWSHPLFASVTASVDRTELALGETFRLEISAEGSQHRSAPETKKLESDFRILNSQQSSEVRILNGQRSATTRWILTLSPLREGKIVLPSLSVGKDKTSPITLTVHPRRESTGAPDQPIWVEAELSQQEAWVQSEVILSLKIFHSVTIAEIPGISLNLPDMTLKSHGDPIVWWATRDSVRYRVYEQRFSLFPQRSGTFDIPAMEMQINVARPSSNFGFFQNYEPYFVTSQPLRLEVKPRPEAYTASHWLPAKQLQLKRLGELPDEWRVGEPVTLTFEIEAEGVIAEQLPDVSPNWPEGVRAYAETAVREDALHQGGAFARLTQKVALIPSRSGLLTLPEVSLTWWNTQTGTQETAILPAQSVTIDVSQETLAHTTTSVSSSEIPPSQGESDAEAATSKANEGEVDYLSVAWYQNDWMWVSLVLLSVWGGTLIYVLRLKKSLSMMRENGSNVGRSTMQARACTQLLHQLKTSALSNHASQTRLLFNQWIVQCYAPRRGRKGEEGVDVCQIKRALPETIQDVLRKLDESLYRQSAPEWDGRHFWSILSLWITQYHREMTQAGKQEQLPELYPDSTPWKKE